MALWSFWRSIAPTLLPRAPAGRRRTAGLEGPLALDKAATGRPCRVLAVHAPRSAPDWGRWLAEIGFLPGERVTVVSRSPWGGDRMVVRVGQSTFALRRAEAVCVHVEPLTS
jgi:ferrous iron transport protein A